MSRRLALAAACAASLPASMPATALAVPSNDNWANRETISSLPFTDVESDIVSATVEATDPTIPCLVSPSLKAQKSLWYSYTTGASTEYLQFRAVRAVGATPDDSVLGVFTGAPGSFEPVPGGCSDDVAGVSGSSNAQATGVRLRPNTTYSLVVGDFPTTTGAGTLTTSVQAPANYTVTKTADTADGVCDADCSLREAVTTMNGTAIGTRGAVLVPPGTYSLTRSGASENANASGDIDLTAATDAIHATGPGVTVQQTVPGERVLHGLAGQQTVTGLQISGGTVSPDGGGIQSTGTGPSGLFTLSEARVSGNTASGSGGGIIASQLWLDRSTVTGNTATTGDGGGVAISTGTSAITRSTISGNTVLGSGGGGGVTAVGALLLDESTIAGNTTNAFGGGLRLTTNTVDTRLISSTIADNRADADGNGVGSGGGLAITTGNAQTIRGLALARNAVGTAGPTSVANDCSSPSALTATSFDFAEAPGTCGFTGTGDQTGGSAQLGTLASNGGPTQTIAPLPGSPLIDAGQTPNCLKGGYTLATDVQTRDQRSFARTVDGDGAGGARCDKGSVEFSAATAVRWRGGRARVARRGIMVRWRFGRVTDVASFEVLRVRGGARRRVATVDGPAVAHRDVYRVHDTGGRPGDRYLVIERRLSGRTVSHGPLRALR